MSRHPWPVGGVASLVHSARTSARYADERDGNGRSPERTLGMLTVRNVNTVRQIAAKYPAPD